MRSFFLREIWPRRDQLFFDLWAIGSLVIACIATFVLNRWGPALFDATPTFGELSTALVAFSAITFGGCLAGATLAVALPSGRTLSVLAINGASAPQRRLIVEENKLVAVAAADGERVRQDEFAGGFRSHYKDLIFLFVYSAYAQLALLGIALAALLLFGETPLFGCSCAAKNSIALAVLLTLALYSLGSLLECLKALFNLGEIRDSSVRGSALEGTGTDFEP